MHLLIHPFMHACTCSFIDSFLHSILSSFLPSFMHSFIHAFLHSFILAFTRSLRHAFFHWFVPSLIHSFRHVPSHWFVPSFIHSVLHAVIDSFLHSLIHSCIHSSIHSIHHSFLHSFIPSFLPCNFMSFHLSSVASLISFLTSSHRIPIGVPLPIVMAYFRHFRPGACQALSGSKALSLCCWSLAWASRASRSAHHVPGSAARHHTWRQLPTLGGLRQSHRSYPCTALDRGCLHSKPGRAESGWKFCNRWQNMTKRHKNT